MQDRIALNPGRVLITPESGEPYYATLTRADNPTQEGTPLNKANLLTDETEAALFGSVSDRTVDQAFKGIANKINLIMSDMATMTLTVKSKAGNPVPGVLVTGMFSDSGGDVYTNASGVASGYVSGGSVTLKISGYADITDYSETISVTKGEAYNKTISITTRNFLKITSSKNLKFSQNVSRVDVWVGGGGGSGYATGSVSAAGGGGGGDSSTRENVSFEPHTIYSAIVGSGGASAASRAGGVEGGASSFLGVSASGGSGGKSSAGGNGNGKGGWCTSSRNKSVNARNGTTYIYTSFTEQTLYGGGGGGVYYDYGDSDDWWSSSAGSPAGGEGKINVDGGAPGTDYLGGGGGAVASIYGSKSGRGGKGVVAIRMHLKSA